MFALGAMHGNGHGLPRDRRTAQEWFRAAAERGHGHAQLMLGRYLASAQQGSRRRRRPGNGWSAPSRRASSMRKPILPNSQHLRRHKATDASQPRRR